MKEKDGAFIWSDAWWIEDDRAWFVDGIKNILFSVDLDTAQCIEAVYIPDPAEFTFRVTPVCVKCDRDIFCIPGDGKRIWAYNLDRKNFVGIDIEKPDQFLMPDQVCIREDALFITSVNWNTVMEVSIGQKAVKHYYGICENDSVERSALAGSSIYMISSCFPQIYEFDLITKKTTTHTLPLAGKKLYAICFDGEKFWLSGYQREVYVWDKENNRCTTINLFLKESGIDESGNRPDDICEFPVFNRIVAVGEYVWFIPEQADEIIYINKKNFTVAALKIFGKDEAEESVLSRKLCGVRVDYLLEYVKNDRYIGLISRKNSRILEIDTKEITFQWKEYSFSDKCLRQCYEIYQGVNKGIHLEEWSDMLSSQIYDMTIQDAKDGAANSSAGNIGTQIYKRLAKGSNMS